MELVQPGDVGVLGGYHGGLPGYYGILAGNHAAQPVNDTCADILRDVLATDASIRSRQVPYVLLAGHCRVVSCMLQRYEKKRHAQAFPC